MLATRRAMNTSTACGAGLTVLGVFAVMTPMSTAIAVTVMIGMLLLLAGLVEIIYALKAGFLGRGVLRFLFGGLTLLAGLVSIATPVRGLGVLTNILAVFLLAGGITDILFALRLRAEEDWGWLLFSGIVSIVAGALIVWQWPVSGAWAVGLFVGLRILAHGWVLMTLGRTGKETLTYLQDRRIEILERHVRAGARTLQEVQAQLADHIAMLLALENEVRKKLSTAEVDPAILELNRNLGEARQRMQAAATATRESWDRTQNEATGAFEELRKSAAVVAGRLKHELGLDKNSGSPGGQTK
jgi:uncharacterized membrane protein HdeD (DUF308 family)